MSPTEQKTIKLNANAKQVAGTAMIATATVMVTAAFVRVASHVMADQLHKLNNKD
jgi:uncharacterized protein (DUF697 family)